MTVKDDNIKTAKWVIGVLFVIFVVGSGLIAVIFFIVSICQVVIPWMKNGKWGDYTKIEDIVRIPADSWYVVREVAELPEFLLFWVIFAFLVAIVLTAISIYERYERHKRNYWLVTRSSMRSNILRPILRGSSRRFSRYSILSMSASSYV